MKKCRKEIKFMKNKNKMNKRKQKLKNQMNKKKSQNETMNNQKMQKIINQMNLLKQKKNNKIKNIILINLMTKIKIIEFIFLTV